MSRQADSHDKLWLRVLSAGKLRYIRRYAKGQRILDIGCGKGWYLHYLIEQGFSVAAMDVERWGRFENVNFVQASAADLPFKENLFDTVIMTDVLEHIKNDVGALEEVSRVTKGRLIISVSNSDDGVLPEYNLTFKHHKDKTHYREYSQEEISAKLEKAGFVVKHFFLEGPISPQICLEFLKLPNILKSVVRYVVFKLCQCGIIKNDSLYADLYLIADKRV